MKTALGIFFLIVFSLQVLPIKQVGKALFKQQITEEVENFSCDDSSEEEPENELNVGNDLQCAFFPILYPGVNTFAANSTQIGQEYIFLQYIAETPTPPPNC